MKPNRPWLMPTSGTSKRRELTGDTEHRAVTAHHHRQIADAAELGAVQRVVGHQAGGLRGGAVKRDVQAGRDEAACHLLDQLRVALALRLADDRGVTKARCGRHAANDRAAALAVSSAGDGRACQIPAENPGRVVHRRGHAGGFAHAVTRLGPGAVAGDHPQRDGRSGRPWPHRQPAHQRRAHPHRARLPRVRRHHAHRAADRRGGPAGGARAVAGRPATARDRARSADAVANCRASSA